MTGQTLGAINCPHCGRSMAVKTDRNNAPFGYCESCKGQLRVGGNALRVEAFRRLHPVIDKAMGGGAPPAQVVVKEPVTVTGKENKFTMFDEE